MQNPSSTGSTNNNNDAVTNRRKAHRKVKTGCKACKARRQKCDEQRPKCSGCIRHSTDCLYTHSEKGVQRNLRQTESPQRETATDRPVQLPTPRTNPRMSPSRDLNFEDLELLHQYITSTCVATSQLPERTTQIQMTIPRLAQTYQFLMRGILGNAAVHLSWLCPSRKAHYTLLAAKHHSLALPEFRSALQRIDQENYSALIMYSKGLVWCSFAWFETISGQVETAAAAAPPSPDDHNNWLPNWFLLLRGSCLLVEYCAPWIKNGLHVLPSLNDTNAVEFSNSLDNRRISALMSQLLPLTASPLCEPVLSALKEAFARASMLHHNTPLRNAVNFWVGKIPNDFVNAVQKAEPWTLVIMAHFSILVFRSETRWFMRGHAAVLLRLISERLPEPWDQYIQWPCEEIGF